MAKVLKYIFYRGNGFFHVISKNFSNILPCVYTEKINEAKKVEAQAKAFFGHALATRQGPRIYHFLDLTKPEVHVDLDKLDADPYI